MVLLIFQRFTINGAFSAGSFIIPFEQRFEGARFTTFAIRNISSAKTFTLSFYIKSTKTGTYVVEAFLVCNRYTVRRQAQSYTISSANTWEKKTITFSGDTAKDINNNNLNTFGLFWWVASGTLLTQAELASLGKMRTKMENRAVGVASSLADDDSFQITGVQMEVGSVATEFEHRSFGEELALCQRYLYAIFC